MKYNTGEDVKLGDIVEVWAGNMGIVVCSMDTDDYTSDFTSNEWSYLKSGILIQSESAGLIHKVNSDEHLKLIRRRD